MHGYNSILFGDHIMMDISDESNETAVPSREPWTDVGLCCLSSVSLGYCSNHADVSPNVLCDTVSSLA